MTGEHTVVDLEIIFREKLVGLEKDLDSIKGLMVSVTEVLRDNLITLSGHDMASKEMRDYLMGMTAALQAKVDSMGEALESLTSIKADISGAHASFGEALGVLLRIEGSLQELSGLKDTRAPNPLARDIREAIESLRQLTERDPETGKPKAGLDLWWPRVTHGFQLAVAGAVLGLVYALLRPFLSFPAHH